MNGKGSRNRTVKFEQYRDNYDNIKKSERKRIESDPGVKEIVKNLKATNIK